MSGGSSASIHPRLVPAAAGTLAHLRTRLRAAYDDGATRLERALGYVRALAAREDSPETERLIGEFERALSEIRLFAALEAVDLKGISALRRRLETICEDLDALRDEELRHTA
jgi:inorganic triphosphatase YgiF